MRIYKFTFKGFFLGGTAVVVANGEDEARELVEQRMRDEGLDITEGNEPLLVDAVTPVKREQIIHFDNGDY